MCTLKTSVILGAVTPTPNSHRMVVSHGGRLTPCGPEREQVRMEGRCQQQRSSSHQNRNLPGHCQPESTSCNYQGSQRLDSYSGPLD